VLAVLQVYLVAEDRVIKVTPPNVRTAKPASEVFFSYNATPGRSEEIVGLSVTGSYSSLFSPSETWGFSSFRWRASSNGASGLCLIGSVTVSAARETSPAATSIQLLCLITERALFM
jgi:hypothetical protein